MSPITIPATEASGWEVLVQNAALEEKYLERSLKWRWRTEPDGSKERFQRTTHRFVSDHQMSAIAHHMGFRLSDLSVCVCVFVL